MPNHVHLLLTPHADVSDFLRRLKSYSARQANRLLQQTGQAFSQPEFMITWSDPDSMLSNPVNAGLVQTSASGSGDPLQAWTPAPQRS